MHLYPTIISSSITNQLAFFSLINTHSLPSLSLPLTYSDAKTQVGRVGESGVESQIRVVASRTLQGATLTCQALNNNITEPAATSLTLDVLCK